MKQNYENFIFKRKRDEHLCNSHNKNEIHKKTDGADGNIALGLSENVYQ